MEQRDLVIIGGGAGGLVVASVAAQLGLDVVLIEAEPQLGGDCLHYGCVPSKALLKVAQVAHNMRHASKYGLNDVDGDVDMLRVNQAVQHAIDAIQPHDSHERFIAMGCELITARAEFINAHTVKAGDLQIKARRIVIATGSEAFIPEIEGLQAIDYLTNESMFSLPELPQSLLILGGGAVGIEMAQAYSRLGSQVTVVEMADRVLPSADYEVSAALEAVLVNEGVTLHTGERVVSASQNSTGIEVALQSGLSLVADKVLVALGRRPVLKTLGLENAGVKYNNRGIDVNRRMQTSTRHIFACGDVTGQMALTHVAELQAGIVIANVVFRIPKRIDMRVVPAVVYTEPECAQVGLTEQKEDNETQYDIVRFTMDKLDRAITDKQEQGFVKLIVKRGRLVGAHIIGPHAGEVIHELALAIQENMKLSRIAGLVHAYPSYSQMNKRAAGQYFSPKLYSSKARTLVKFIHRILP